MKKLLINVSLVALITGLSGCMAHSGKMNIASISNEVNIIEDESLGEKVQGESCKYHLFMIPWGETENRVENATKNAIDKAHKQGLKGDKLIHRTVELVSSGFMMYRKNCFVVEGYLSSKDD